MLGTERSFISTSRSKVVALGYSAHNHQVGERVLFKYVTQGLNRGPSIGYLSLYPDEAEHLYAPLTYLEPKRIYEEGGATVIEVTPTKA